MSESPEGYSGLRVNPRHYQRTALRKIWMSWQKHKRILLVMGTGTGKTIVFSMLANHIVKNEGKRVLILAHREELINQASEKLLASTGIHSSIEKGSETAHDSLFPVVIGSIQSLSSRNRLERYSNDSFDYIIVDETHRILANTYQLVLGYFSTAKVLGVTATPIRGDEQNLGKFFQKCCYEYGLRSAINDGWLTPIKSKIVPVEIDLNDASISSGDISKKFLDHALTPHLAALCDQIIEHASDRKTLVFLPLVVTSKHMVEILKAKGVPAMSIDGTLSKEKRMEVLDWYQNAPPPCVLCNSMILTEGYDQTDIDCVMVARATKSQGLYQQMVGRGTRVLDLGINQAGLSSAERKLIIATSAKKSLLVLDPIMLSAKHRLCSVISLVTENGTHDTYVREQITGKEVSLEDVEALVETDSINQREMTLSRELDALKGKDAVELNPVLQSMSLIDGSIKDWDSDSQLLLSPITTQQISALKSFGIKSPETWSTGYAGNVLSVIANRKARGLSSPKQLKMMVSRNVPNAHTKTFSEASKIINRLQYSWKR